MKKMKNKTFLLLILLALVFLVVIIFYNKIKIVCINSACFKVKVAKTAEEKRKGLMFKTTLPADSGMIFVYDKEGTYPIWMKNTLIPLDVIWIDKDNKIIDIKSNLPPCKTENCEVFKHKGKAKYILELNAGVVDENNIKVGDIVRFNSLYTIWR